jgi:hypothetical protein
MVGMESSPLIRYSHCPYLSFMYRALLVFHELDLEAGKIDYTIRMNYSTVPTTRRIAQRFNLGLDTTYSRYFLSGYLSLQTMIESAMLNATSLPPNNMKPSIFPQTRTEAATFLHSTLSSSSPFTRLAAILSGVTQLDDDSTQPYGKTIHLQYR